MFDPASVFKRLQYSYKADPLAAKLRAELDRALKHSSTQEEPNATLGSSGLRTLLMMVLRNHTTDSPWPVSNNSWMWVQTGGPPDKGNRRRKSARAREARG